MQVRAPKGTQSYAKFSRLSTYRFEARRLRERKEVHRYRADEPEWTEPGIALELGHGSSCAMPVYEGQNLQDYAKRSDVAGKQAQSFLTSAFFGGGCAIRVLSCDGPRSWPKVVLVRCAVGMGMGDRGDRSNLRFDSEGG